MVNVLPFLGSPPEQRRPAPQQQQPPKTGALPAPEPTFLQRVVGRPAERGPTRPAGRGILVPGQQLPHITLNTVQVRQPVSIDALAQKAILCGIIMRKGLILASDTLLF
jgi:hypothetical protein